MKLLTALPFHLLILATIASADEECTLACQNTGVCRFGNPSFGYASETDEEDPTPIGGSGSASRNMFCECPRGYAGPYCEVALVLCEGDQTKCFNGANCIKAQTDNGGTFSHCECDVRKTDFSGHFVSSFCQQIGTVYCSTQVEGEATARHTFCTNGGRCNKLVAANEKHQGCECAYGWEGPHCQFFSVNIVDMGDDNSKDPANAAGSPAGIIVGVLFGVLISVVIGVMSWRSCHKKKVETEQKSELELQRQGDPYGIEDVETERPSSEII